MLHRIVQLRRTLPCILTAPVRLHTRHLVHSMARPLGASTDVIADILPHANFPAAWPFGAEAFQRDDESPDGIFYSVPRFVKHIDDAAIFALTMHYEESFSACTDEEPAVLDLCSSWISHFPDSLRTTNVVGLGMVEAELSRNGQLSRYVVQDLNKDTKLPFDDNSFDFVTCTVSIDYLVHPQEVLGECLRVLRPGGSIIISFSNRMFPTKATAIWRATDDADHVWIVGAFLHYARIGGQSTGQSETGQNGTGGATARFVDLQALDLSPSDRTDPLYVVKAKKGS